jgi:deoxyribodipyrimidine photo-lyase
LQREFRLNQFPALSTAMAQAKKEGQALIFAYFHDPEQTIGLANALRLAHSLQQLQQTAEKAGGQLWIVEGRFQEKLSQVISNYQVSHIHYTHQVGSTFTSMQRQALDTCRQQNVNLTPHFSETLLPLGALNSQKQQPYVVFTPFYKAFLSKQRQIEPLDFAPVNFKGCRHPKALNKKWLSLPEDLVQLMSRPWAQKVMVDAAVGEKAAWQRFTEFLENDIQHYAEKRDFPALDATSRLSSHLHFGEITHNGIYFTLQSLLETGDVSAEAAYGWLRQLVWAEFAKNLLWHFPHTETEPFQARFNAFEWEHDDTLFKAWQKGETGIPIIDAGMRQLWQSGTMHNRVRMLTASFLTKNLNLSWRDGKAWFEGTLLDADPAKNTMNWQWVAGCGVDAAPYYRLFNPILQSQKFDPNGDYLRRWLPELSPLSNRAIHAPWEAPGECLRHKITLGETYPRPVIDLKASREAHLARVELLKTRQGMSD